jgi:hypothetical protein
MADARFALTSIPYVGAAAISEPGSLSVRWLDQLPRQRGARRFNTGNVPF